jgi:hypothetical protein
MQLWSILFDYEQARASLTAVILLLFFTCNVYTTDVRVRLNAYKHVYVDDSDAHDTKKKYVNRTKTSDNTSHMIKTKKYPVPWKKNGKKNGYCF